MSCRAELNAELKTFDFYYNSVKKCNFLPSGYVRRQINHEHIAYVQNFTDTHRSFGQCNYHQSVSRLQYSMNESNFLGIILAYLFITSSI